MSTLKLFRMKRHNGQQVVMEWKKNSNIIIMTIQTNVHQAQAIMQLPMN